MNSLSLFLILINNKKINSHTRLIETRSINWQLERIQFEYKTESIFSLFFFFFSFFGLYIIFEALLFYFFHLCFTCQLNFVWENNNNSMLLSLVRRGSGSLLAESCSNNWIWEIKKKKKLSRFCSERVGAMWWW